MERIFPDSAETVGGHLYIGGCDTVDLAERFGTPLLVLDRACFERRAGEYADALSPEQVYYAGKSFLCVAICQLLDRLGLGLDVCTGGELATALAAGFPPERIIFHGNNKSVAELEAARRAEVGRVVVDSFHEIERIAKVGMTSRLLVRVTPGVEAHTHEFVQTGQEDSKFGFGLADGSAFEAVKKMLDLDRRSLVGLHAHIGSQILDAAAFELVVERLAIFCEQLKSKLNLQLAELNVGGGLGIAHTEEEVTPDVASLIEQIRSAIDREFSARELSIPKMYVEPGRSIVGPAAVTLYEVGTVKTISGARMLHAGGLGRNMTEEGVRDEQRDRVYVSVNGGMSDNPRFPLYGAKYEAFLANRMDDMATLWTTVAGKHCESGDILIKDVQLPSDVHPGDLLCIPATGAYTYSMASNYNHVPRPAVVLVEDGRATEIVRRETIEDLLRRDLFLD